MAAGVAEETEAAAPRPGELQTLAATGADRDGDGGGGTGGGGG